LRYSAGSDRQGLVQGEVCVIASACEGVVHEGLEVVDAAGQVVRGVELVSRGGLGPFDASISRLGRLAGER
jgi:hypothetical protein